MRCGWRSKTPLDNISKAVTTVLESASKDTGFETILYRYRSSVALQIIALRSRDLTCAPPVPPSIRAGAGASGQVRGQLVYPFVANSLARQRRLLSASRAELGYRGLYRKRQCSHGRVGLCHTNQSCWDPRIHTGARIVEPLHAPSIDFASYWNAKRNTRLEASNSGVKISGLKGATNRA